MKLTKIIDSDITQLYNIQNADDKWNKKFPKKNVCIIYDFNNKSVYVENVDVIPVFKLIDKLSYVFSKQPAKQLEKSFKFMQYMNTNDNIIKRCGFNGVNSELLTNGYNAVISLMSLKQYEYSPLYLPQEIYIRCDYDKLINLNDYQNIFNKIVVKHCEQYKLKHVIDFIEELKNNFPLNYGGTVRRFVNIIDNKALTNNEINDDIKYYIGYDCRTATTNDEIKLSQHIENDIYNIKNECVYVYETYNNPMKTIKEICKNENIKYKDIHKHCIKINNDDYNKLSTKLTATLSDFIC